MEARQIPLVFALVGCVAMLVAVPVVGVGVDGGQSPQVENNTTSSTNETSGANESFGSQVSAFMQASAVDANTTVESGMFNAAVNTSQAPEREVTARADRLERELQRLEDKAARLEAKRANGTLPDVAYTAQASAIRERLVNLQEQINGTETAAKRVGVNVSSLDRLRTQAANMTGPEVSALARNITDAPRGPPEGVPGNPPGDAGPPGNDSGPSGDAGPSGNMSGPPDEAGQQGNETGPPRETGPQGNDSGPSGDAGPSDDAGPSGNETGTPETGTPTDGRQTPSGEDPSTDQGTRTGTPDDTQGPQGGPEAPSGQRDADSEPQSQTAAE